VWHPRFVCKAVASRASTPGTQPPSDDKNDEVLYAKDLNNTRLSTKAHKEDERIPMAPRGDRVSPVVSRR
jgi:hypothetical protein